MNRRVLLALGGLAASTGLLITSAGPASASHSWGNYHWATSNGTAQLTVINSSTSDWSSRLRTAVADWERSPSLSLSITRGDSSRSTRSRCPFPTGGNTVRVCNDYYGNTGWSGVATINTSDGTHIATGTDKQNETYLSSGTEAARQHVVCQEIGHLWGLDHQFTNAGSCMDYAGINDPSYTHPNQHDYAELNAIYDHGDFRAAKGKPSHTSKIKAGNTVTSILWVD